MPEAGWRAWLVIGGVLAACLLPGLVVGLALGYRSFDALSTAAGLGWFVTITLLPFLLARLRPRKGRVLLLRRFGLERPPAFPVSKIVAKLSIHGLEVVTLADATISTDRDTHAPFATLIAAVLGWIVFMGVFLLAMLAVVSFPVSAAVMVALLMALMVAAAGAVLWPVRGRAPFLHMLGSAERIVARTLAAILPLRRDLRRSTEAELTTMLAQPVRRDWQLGIAVVAASDENWQEVVGELARTSDHVLVDLTSPSPNLSKEIAMLAATYPGDQIVWLRSEATTIDGRVGPGGYTILGHSFRGEMKEYVYPARGPAGFDDFHTAGGFDPWLLAETERLRLLLGST